MSLGQGLYDHLTADPAVTALIGVRFTPAPALQGGATPYAVYQLIGIVRERTRALDGPNPLVRARVQIDVYADTLLAAQAAAAAIRRALDGYRGLLGTVKAGSIMVEDDRDLYDRPAELRRVSFDVIIWHEEE